MNDIRDENGHRLELSGIPLDDPGAALEFCRRLHGALKDERESGARLPVPELSVVVPVYNEENVIPELHKRLTATLDAEGVRYELLFVDDGSADRSGQMLADLARTDDRVGVVGLARNFGHQVAITAGLDFARGRAVAVMDADLQDPPEELPRLLAKWREGYEVVYAVRRERKEGFLKRACYALFYRILCRIANVKMPLDSGDFCVMDRKAVDMVQSMRERNRFVRGLRSWVGLQQIGVEYERHSRCSGRAKYTWGRLLLLALDGLVSFSHAPLRAASLFGVAISLTSLVLAAFYTVKKLTVGLSPPGFATLITAFLFLSGIQLLTIGVMGEYVGRIFDEVKRRPLYTVRQVRSPGAGRAASEE